MFHILLHTRMSIFQIFEKKIGMELTKRLKIFCFIFWSIPFQLKFCTFKIGPQNSRLEKNNIFTFYTCFKNLHRHFLNVYLTSFFRVFATAQLATNLSRAFASPRLATRQIGIKILIIVLFWLANLSTPTIYFPHLRSWIFPWHLISYKYFFCLLLSILCQATNQVEDLWRKLFNTVMKWW